MNKLGYYRIDLDKRLVAVLQVDNLGHKQEHTDVVEILDKMEPKIVHY